MYFYSLIKKIANYPLADTLSGYLSGSEKAPSKQITFSEWLNNENDTTLSEKSLEANLDKNPEGIRLYAFVKSMLASYLATPLHESPLKLEGTAKAHEQCPVVNSCDLAVVSTPDRTLKVAQDKVCRVKALSGDRVIASLYQAKDRAFSFLISSFSLWTKPVTTDRPLLAEPELTLNQTIINKPIVANISETPKEGYFDINVLSSQSVYAIMVPAITGISLLALKNAYEFYQKKTREGFINKIYKCICPTKIFFTTKEQKEIKKIIEIILISNKILK